MIVHKSGFEIRDWIIVILIASPRDCAIDSYAGQIGEITNYYWISPRVGEVFYIYMVRVGTGYEEIALHEDEIEAYMSRKSLKTRD